MFNPHTEPKWDFVSLLVKVSWELYELYDYNGFSQAGVWYHIKMTAISNLKNKNDEKNFNFFKTF